MAFEIRSPIYEGSLWQEHLSSLFLLDRQCHEHFFPAMNFVFINGIILAVFFHSFPFIKISYVLQCLIITFLIIKDIFDVTLSFKY